MNVHKTDTVNTKQLKYDKNYVKDDKNDQPNVADFFPSQQKNSIVRVRISFQTTIDWKENDS